MTSESPDAVYRDDDERSADRKFQRQPSKHQERGNDQEAAAHSEKSCEAAHQKAVVAQLGQ